MEAAIRDLKALANRHRFEETLGRSIFAYVIDAVAHGLPRYSIPDRLACEANRSSLEGVYLKDSGNNLSRLRAAGSDQSEQAGNFDPRRV